MSEKKKILMIDDEKDLCELVKLNLQDTGQFEVTTLSNPLDAEKVIAQVMPDLILMDVVMPGRKGNEIVQALKKNDATKKIPIVMVSGKGEMVFNKGKNEFKWLPNNPLAKQRGELPEAKGAEALAQAYGVVDYVAKPFTTELLMEVINDVLKRTGKAEPSSEENV